MEGTDKNDTQYSLYCFKMDGLIDDSNGEMFTHMFEFIADGEMKVSEMKEFLAKKLKVTIHL